MNTPLLLPPFHLFAPRPDIACETDCGGPEKLDRPGSLYLRGPFLDDFDRNVYCLLGLPVDAVSMAGAMCRVHAAAEQGKPCFLSTPNLNFLVASQGDPAFRDSVVNSDLSVVDGLPVAWMARRLGIPIRKRVTGSGLFEALWKRPSGGKRLSVYFFGGPDGAAEAACHAMNAHSPGLCCAGYQSPGYGTVEDLSGEEAIARINASAADFLIVSLGARKGQAWIERNRARLAAPVISHLGAVVNFAAGTVSRAPAWMQRSGLEWLWRIKEEPALWRRYWQDGLGLLRLFFTRLLPYALWLSYHRVARARQAENSALGLTMDAHGCRISLRGAVPDQVPALVRGALREAALCRTEVVLDCAEAGYLSPAFFGLLLLLRKHQNATGKPLRIVGLSPRLRRLFRWNGVDYLLDEVVPSPAQACEDAVDGASNLAVTIGA